MSSFYLTTPIYYVNDKPHIGHAYTTILGDVITGYHRGMGEDVWFLTGTDEHGQKVQKAAAEHNMTPMEQCDSTVVRFQELWKKLGIRNDDFIRTTQERHKTIPANVSSRTRISSTAISVPTATARPTTSSNPTTSSA